MEEVALNDWPDEGGANSWLPAYGFRTPIGLLEKEDFLGNPDAEYFLNGTSAHYYHLETIHEETSDDLRSDSDVSDIQKPSSKSYWLTTDSDNDSVICMEANNDSDDCESEREIACPIKRRRQNEIVNETILDSYQSLSRSSSLLQFETLEKQCQENSCSTLSLYSQFSLDSLESRTKNITSFELLTSNDSNRAWRSLDNLAKKKELHSTENLSEDSGFGEQQMRAIEKKTTSSSFEAYDYSENFLNISGGGSGGKFGASCQNLSVVANQEKWLNLEQVEECCRDKYKLKCYSSSEPDLKPRDCFSERVLNVQSVPKNLDLIGEKNVAVTTTSIALKNCDLTDFFQFDKMANFKREGSYEQAMRNRIDLSDDESSLCFKKTKSKGKIVEFDRKVLQVISESIHSINSASIADSNLDDIYGAIPAPSTIRRNVVSTPNLVMNPQEQERFVDMLLQEERRRSVQDLPRKSSIVNHSTSTSCVSDFEEKTLNYESGSTKEVHFSPVVSELNATPSDGDNSSSSTYSLSSTPSDLKALTLSLLDSSQNRPLPESRRPYRLPPDAFPSYDEPPIAPTPYRPLSQPDLRPIALRSSFSQSQPDVHRLKRRGSQLMKKDEDGCTIKAYVDGDGIQYRHTHLDIDEPIPNSHVVTTTGRSGGNQQQQRGGFHETVDVMEVQRKETKQQQQKKKLGGFFSRLASFRFSNRKDDKNKKKNKQDAATNKKDNPFQSSSQRIATKEDYIYIPLKGPTLNSSESVTKAVVTTSKPPLPRAPPRVISASVKKQQASPPPPLPPSSSSSPPLLQQQHHRQNGTSTASSNSLNQRRRKIIDSCGSSQRPMEPMGLIETDLDTQVTQVISGSCNNNAKTRSLMNLGAETVGRYGLLLDDVDATGSVDPEEKGGHRRPHKSMEFLLDKDNLKVVEPPENDLQKTDRVMSEHQLRVQRSLQKLNVPDWYKQSSVPREGFILNSKTHHPQRWPQQTNSKTTSLNSLGSSPIVLSPTYYHNQQPFVRWSTSKLNSTASSPCTSTRSSFNIPHRRRDDDASSHLDGSVSPASIRSSFSYRQPYMGWRSQERLNKPKTPSERLANSLITARNRENPEIQTSIKEVTSAIVHYVSTLKPNDDSNDSQKSPRGSTQKLCWLESSFVGIRPLDSPQTPVTFNQNQTDNDAPSAGLRLELQTKRNGESVQIHA